MRPQLEDGQSKRCAWLGRWLWFLAMASTVLLVYASLVPLTYQPLPWEATWTRWQSIPWLQLELYNRSDWIANALVVMPPAFFWCGAIDFGRDRRWIVWLAAPVIATLLCALVVGIECLQVWFPPRTVSQNDIVAGCVGAVLGCVAWLMIGRWCVRAIEYFVQIERVRGRVRWVVAAAIVGGLLYTVYPFDLVLNGSEWKEKLELGRLGWGMEWSSKQEFLKTLKGCVVACVKIAPFGMWFALKERGKFPWLAIPLIAIGLEAIQIPIYTKYATVVEAVFGAVGGWAAWLVTRLWLSIWPQLQRGWIWAMLSVLYGGALLVAFNWRFESIVRDDAVIRQRFMGAFDWPLVKYYYTSEYSAISNVIGKLGAFAVLGGLVCIWNWVVRPVRASRWFWIGAIATFVLGAAIEGMQVFLPPIIPDVNDLVTYVLGYATGFAVVSLVLSGASEPRAAAMLREGESLASRDR